MLGSTGILLSISTGIFCLYNRRRSDQSTLILSTLLIIIGLTLFNETLATSGISNRFKNLYFLPLNFSLSIAPLFYLFIKVKIHRNFASVDYVHLLLPVLQFFIFMIVGFQSIAYKTKLWNNELFRAFLNAETILFIIGIFLYAGLAYKLVNRSYDDKLYWKEDLRKWLLRMVKFFFFIATLELSLFIGELILSTRFGQVVYVFRALVFVLLIALLVYNTIKLLYPISIYRSSPIITAIDPAESNKLQARIESLMNQEKIYLNPDLSIGILSEYLGTSQKKCSKFFSATLNTNFKQYVNNYRVKEFKRNITSGTYDSWTILSIAFESGFDSKTTFNRVFKQIEGITPSKFIKESKK